MADVVVAKRVDRYLVVENLIGSVDMCRYWMENVVISDHIPFALKIEKGTINPGFSFMIFYDLH